MERKIPDAKVASVSSPSGNSQLRPSIISGVGAWLSPLAWSSHLLAPQTRSSLYRLVVGLEGGGVGRASFSE